MTKSVESNGGACRRQGCGGQAEETERRGEKCGLSQLCCRNDESTIAFGQPSCC